MKRYLLSEPAVLPRYKQRLYDRYNVETLTGWTMASVTSGEVVSGEEVYGSELHGNEVGCKEIRRLRQE